MNVTEQTWLAAIRERVAAPGWNAGDADCEFLLQIIERASRGRVFVTDQKLGPDHIKQLQANWEKSI